VSPATSSPLTKFLYCVVILILLASLAGVIA
jgi:hypothetical protein